MSQLKGQHFHSAIYRYDNKKECWFFLCFVVVVATIATCIWSFWS